MTRHADKAAFVMVHGGWHNGETWHDLSQELDRIGHAVIANDLPGAGADQPRLESGELGTRPSAVAGVTHAQRVEAVVSDVRSAASAGNGQVVLVGHSAGGATISPVAEQIPDELKAVVYLSAFLLPNGMLLGEWMGHEAMASSQVLPLLVADPAEVGAFRIDAASTHPEYLATMKSGLYGDLTEQQFGAARTRLHYDEPAALAAEPSIITAERFGTVDRHFIKCTQDRAVTPEAQDLMIRLVDEQTATSTTVHSMDTSHNPLYSDPLGLANILVSIAA